MCVSIAAAANRRERGTHCSALAFVFIRVCVSGRGRFLVVRFGVLHPSAGSWVDYTLQQEGQLMSCFPLWMVSCVLWASCAASLQVVGHTRQGQLRTCLCYFFVQRRTAFDLWPCSVLCWLHALPAEGSAGCLRARGVVWLCICRSIPLFVHMAGGFCLEVRQPCHQ